MSLLANSECLDIHVPTHSYFLIKLRFFCFFLINSSKNTDSEVQNSGEHSTPSIFTSFVKSPVLTEVTFVASEQFYEPRLR